MEIIMASVQNDDMHLNMKVLKATDNYVMGEKEDTRLESDYLILWGTLADGNLLLARTPLESIKESAQVSNRLLMDVGVVAVIVSGIIIFLLPAVLLTQFCGLQIYPRKWQNSTLMQSMRSREIMRLNSWASI